MNLKKSILFILGVTLSIIGYAQQNSSTGTVRGFVYLKETGEPQLFTNVILKGTTIGNATDVNGYFSITKIPPGSYTIMIASGLGYDTLQENFTVKAGEVYNKKYKWLNRMLN